MLRLPVGLLLIMGLLPRVVLSNALYPVTLEEKVKNSSIIAEGVVESQYSFWNEAHTMIFTSNRVKVYKVFSGVVSTGYLNVLTQGGSIENFNIHASDLLDLTIGEAGTFFCFPNQVNLKDPQDNQLLLDVYSSSQGCYKYNTINYSAHVAFESYVSITRGLYPAITALTGKAIVNLQPTVSFEDPGIGTVGQDAITTFTPAVVNAGTLLQSDSNLLTINGSGFGTASGSAAIIFKDADQGGLTNITIAYSSPLIQSWSDTQIKIKVPAKAGTGTIKVRNSSSVEFESATALKVNYAVLTGTFTGGVVLQIGLANTNGLGGYDVLYCTSTLGGGRNLNTALEKAPIQRAITTWKEICGANIREAGTTTVQTVGSNDANVLVLDNTNTGVPLLAAGVLASTYSYSSACTSGGQFIYPAYKTGFDVLIRNNGVSTGSTNFTLGPCPPATNVNQLDFETVIMHELGHALSLGHIIDSYEGTQLPYVNPPKLMYYSIPNGVKRVTPDFSAKSAGDYNSRQKAFNYGSCFGFTEMVPVAKILEAKDECPLSFPVATTSNNTQVNFDLVHATSNSNVDPQYTNITCNGNGTGVTNNAYYALKTNSSGTDLILTVSNYQTDPAAQQNCTVAGVQLTLYRVNSCPQGQNFPTPAACRTFNGNGVLASFTNLVKDATYLLMVNGLSNTKASFTLTFNGTLLPVKLVSFVGSENGDDNIISWSFDKLTDLYDVALQRSTDGVNFETIQYWDYETYELKTNYIDKVPPSSSYYRLVYNDKQGLTSYSPVIQLKHNVTISWKVYPNPARGNIHIYARNITRGHYTLMLFNSAGMLVSKRDQAIGDSVQNFIIPVAGLSSGNYKMVVCDWNGNPVFTSSVSVMP